MKTIEGLEKQLADALARERLLLEIVARADALLVELWSEIMEGNGDALDQEKRIDACRTKIADTIATPAPRVFTVEECRPLVEALQWMELTEAAHSNAARAECKLCNALAHARKLGMEGAE